MASLRVKRPKTRPASGSPPARLRGHGRERILVEARRLFLAEDFGDVSMQRIADGARLTKAALYYHFPDKIALYEAVVRHELARARDSIAVAAASEVPLEERLRRVALAVYSIIDGDLMRMTEDLFRHVPDNRHRELHTEMQEAFSTMASAFEREPAAKVRPGLDPALAATLFFHLVAGLIDPGQPGWDRLIEVAPKDAAAKAALVARLFSRGYSTFAEGTQRAP